MSTDMLNILNALIQSARYTLVIRCPAAFGGLPEYTIESCNGEDFPIMWTLEQGQAMEVIEAAMADEGLSDIGSPKFQSMIFQALLVEQEYLNVQQAYDIAKGE